MTPSPSKKPIAKVVLRNLETGEDVTDQYVSAPPDFIHPETGELLATEEDWRAALAAIEERMAPLYRLRRVLRDEAAERFAPAAQPAARYRTDKQNAVARCPRCGGRLDES